MSRNKKQLADEHDRHKREELRLENLVSNANQARVKLINAGDALAALLELPGKKPSKARVLEVVSVWESVRTK